MDRTAVKWAGAVGAVVAVVALWWLAPVEQWVKGFNEWIDGLGAIGYLVFGGVYVIATVALTPGSILTLAAGLAFGLWAFPLVVVAATIGACLAFLVGRYLARESLESRFENSRRFHAIDRAVRDEGWKVVGLMRLSPLIPFNLQNYLFGLTKVDFGHYALATFFGIMPGTLMYVYFGAAGRAALSEAAGEETSTLKWVFFGVGLIATIIVTVIITRKAKQRLEHTEVAEVDDR